MAVESSVSSPVVAAAPGSGSGSAPEAESSSLLTDHYPAKSDLSISAPSSSSADLPPVDRLPLSPSLSLSPLTHPGNDTPAGPPSYDPNPAPPAVSPADPDPAPSTVPDSLPAAPSSPRPELVCCVCFDSISPSTSHFVCPSGSLSHSQCLNCFTAFLRSSCSSYAESNSFPLRCCYGACNAAIPDSQLFALLRASALSAAESTELINLYERFSVLAGLLDVSKSPNTTIFTCRKCEKFTLILPADYKRRAGKLKEIQRREQLEEERRIAEQKKTKKEKRGQPSVRNGGGLQAETLFIRGGGNVSEPQLDAEQAQIMRQLAEENGTSLEEQIRLMQQLTGQAAPAPPNPVRRSSLREESETQHPAFARGRSIERVTRPVQLSDIRPRLVRGYSAPNFPPATVQGREASVGSVSSSSASRIHSVSSAPAGERDKSKQSQADEKEEKKDGHTTRSVHLDEESEPGASAQVSNPSAAADNPPESKPGLDRQMSESSLTSLFVICETPGCESATCLFCDSLFDSADVLKHQCARTPVDDMYDRVLDVLAAGATQRCPNPSCQLTSQPVLKDLACNHVTSSCCSTRWCYVCGKQFDDFSAHNTWNIRTEKRDGTCPMYLQYRYGQGSISPGSTGFSSGDPMEALELFHIERQQQLIQSFESQLSETDAAIYQQMKEIKFPGSGGLWEPEKLQRLQEINREIEAAKLQPNALDWGLDNQPQFEETWFDRCGSTLHNCCCYLVDCECFDDHEPCALYEDDQHITSCGICCFVTGAVVCCPFSVPFLCYQRSIGQLNFRCPRNC